MCLRSHKPSFQLLVDWCKCVWDVIEEFGVCERVCVCVSMILAEQRFCWILQAEWASSGSLCLACHRPPLSSCPRDGCALLWMFHRSLGDNSTFPTLFSPLCLCQVRTIFKRSLILVSLFIHENVSAELVSLLNIKRFFWILAAKALLVIVGVVCLPGGILATCVTWDEWAWRQTGESLIGWIRNSEMAAGAGSAMHGEWESMLHGHLVFNTYDPINAYDTNTECFAKLDFGTKVIPWDTSIPTSEYSKIW